MADITITPANVFKGANSTLYVGIAHEAIQAGYAIGRENDGTFSRIFANDAPNGCTGIALCNCAAGQPFVYVKDDTALDLGLSSSDMGKNLYVSPTGITFDFGDISSLMQVITLGNVTGTDGQVTLSIINGGVLE